MTMWKIQVEELVRTFSDYVVTADSKEEAKKAVRVQDNDMILDKPKSIEEQIDVRRIISIREIKGD